MVKYCKNCLAHLLMVGAMMQCSAAVSWTSLHQGAGKVGVGENSSWSVIGQGEQGQRAEVRERVAEQRNTKLL